MASTVSRIWQSISEGLIFGFTFALGWIAAVMLTGVFVA
jgi:hypothetical protein